MSIAAKRHLTVLLLSAAAAGCNSVPGEKFQQTQRELQAAQETVARLEKQAAEQYKNIENLQKQVAELRGLSQDALADLVYPEKIEFARMSGGYNADERAGDDYLVLYIQPVDRDGHVVKAAGALTVTLLDLHEPTKPVVVSEYKFDVKTTRQLWYGQLMTNHWTVRCPWPPSGPPAHDRITAKATFTDLLTGRTLETQGVFTITLPPADRR